MRLAGIRANRVGFVFTKDDPFAGVDNCRNPDTGRIDPWAQDIIGTLHSYSEISPSGTGVNIFLRGKPPANAKHKVNHQTGSVEVYDSGRYFTVPGQHVAGTPPTVEDRQAELTTVYAAVFGIEPAPANSSSVGGPSEPIGKGQRTNVLCRLIGKMIDSGVPANSMEATALTLNAGFNPPLDELQVKYTVRDMVLRYLPEPAPD
jgi:hypothetical protein